MVASKANYTSSMGVYIHWPFCSSKCPYCDFNSHTENAVDHSRWRHALLTELNYFANETKERMVTSVFFGGGTPSLMAPETTADLIEAIKSYWTTPQDLEITLEANPSTADSERFIAFRDAGVNRLSIGVQSLQDENLKYLGRGHSAADAIGAISLAAKTFPRFSFDLIYGLPGQTRSQWKEELNKSMEYAGNHLSVYQLTIEPGTQFFRDQVSTPSEKIGIALFEDTQTILETAGFIAYEISNHARSGQHCQHNLDIWKGGDYAGIGPGAHGRLTNALGTDAIYQTYKPERWLEKVEKNGHATAKRIATDMHRRAEENLMTGLRLGDGITKSKLNELEGFINKINLKRMINGGFIEMDKEGLRTTTSGRLCLNEVLSQLLDNT